LDAPCSTYASPARVLTKSPYKHVPVKLNHLFGIMAGLVRTSPAMTPNLMVRYDGNRFSMVTWVQPDKNCTRIKSER